jgi:hypothetical protein
MKGPPAFHPPNLLTTFSLGSDHKQVYNPS